MKSLVSPFAGYSRHNEVLERLRALEPDLKRQGIAHLHVFGSVVRGDDTAESDLDLAFDLSADAVAGFSLIDQSRLTRQLTGHLERLVDLVERACLRSRILKTVEGEMVTVF